MMDFTDRVAVVTGGTSGIGEAVMRQFAELGARPVSWSRSEEADVRCDIRDPESIRAALAETVSAYGAPSLLVANSGINGRAPFVATAVEDWDRILEVNARGTFLTMQAVAAQIIEAGLDGSMVVVSSTAGTLTDPETVPYSVSKAGIIHLARIAAVELGKHGIRVNCVSPGPTETPMTRRTLGREDYRQVVVDTTPLGGIASPDQVAEAIVGMMRMEWVTGQTIDVDGGTGLVTPRGALRASYGSFLGDRRA